MYSKVQVDVDIYICLISSEYSLTVVKSYISLLQLQLQLCYVNYKLNIRIFVITLAPSVTNGRTVSLSV